MGREGPGGRDQVQSEPTRPDPQDQIVPPGLLPGRTGVLIQTGLGGEGGAGFCSDVRGCGAHGPIRTVLRRLGVDDLGLS